MMFTTNVHGWLHAATGGYGIAWALAVGRRPGAARLALAAGLLLQSLYLIGRGWLGDVFLPNPIVEGPFILPWCLALIALVRGVTGTERAPAWILSLVLIFAVFASFYAKGMIPPTPKKTTLWAVAFFASESMAHALFYSAALFALLSFFRKDLAGAYHPLLVWGFVLYTMAQVTGAIWCFVGWGNTFSWGSRHLGSAAVWTFFAASLHLQFIPGWRRRNPALVVAGAALLFYISYGHYFEEMHFQRVGG